MNKRFIVAGFLLAGAALGSIAAQTAQAGTGPSPFVSALTAETRNNLVRLRWTDSSDVHGPVFIFRSHRPFIDTIPPDVEPAEIAYGIQLYIDEIDESRTFYYFIAASDLLGKRHDMIIPDVNTITVTSSGEAHFTEYSTLDMLPELGISGIEARIDGEAVVITYDSDVWEGSPSLEGAPSKEGGPNNAILYRSLQPVKRPQDLIHAVIVQSGISSPYIDYPIPGLSWYYAVISEEELIEGSVGIYPGRNATITAALIPGGEMAADGRRARSMPLPALSAHNLVPGIDYSSVLTKPLPLSRENQIALSSIEKAPPIALPEKKPRVFKQDLEEPAGGEDSTLMRIVQGSFIKRNWGAARDELERYLFLPRSPETEARARFYLGQACYFSGHYREALLEFLSAQSLYPDEMYVWIEATLTAMISH